MTNPGFVPPMLAKLVKVLPEGPGWEYEVKLDGYRLEATKDGDRVRLYSRNGNDFTKKFAKIATRVSQIKASSLVLDGEAVALDEQGKPSFQMLQNRGSLPSGKVHQGLNPANRRALLKVLQPLAIEKCSFANLPSSRSGHWGDGVTDVEMNDYVWLKPKAVAEIKFAEWTEGGVLRHAEFITVQDDKDPKETVREKLV